MKKRRLRREAFQRASELGIELCVFVAVLSGLWLIASPSMTTYKPVFIKWAVSNNLIKEGHRK